MTCVHLRQLYQFCQQERLRISSSDLIHVVCEQCGVQEECPSMLTDEYDARQSAPNAESPPDRDSTASD